MKASIFLVNQLSIYSDICPTVGMWHNGEAYEFEDEGASYKNRSTRLGWRSGVET
jgi:hypothetical protein